MIPHGERPPFGIVRYDRVVEDFLVTGNFAGWLRMTTDFPRETQVLVEGVLQLGHVEDEGIDDSLRAYYRDPTLVRVRFDVAKKFGNMRPYEKELGEVFAKLERELPDFVTPKVYTQISAFNQSIVVGDSLIGISLDKYMGADYAYYRRYFYENQRVTMTPERMVQDCLVFYLNQLYPSGGLKSKQLELGGSMMHQGKIYWVIAKLSGKDFIDVAGLVPATKRWYVNHEHDVWKRIGNTPTLRNTDRDFIFSILTSSHESPYFNEPHSRGVGLWIGMRIIDSYMRHNPNVTINELMHDTDYPSMLQASHYNP